MIVLSIVSFSLFSFTVSFTCKTLIVYLENVPHMLWLGDQFSKVLKQK
jgi:hypothetical protein